MGCPGVSGCGCALHLLRLPPSCQQGLQQGLQRSCGHIFAPGARLRPCAGPPSLNDVSVALACCCMQVLPEMHCSQSHPCQTQTACPRTSNLNDASVLMACRCMQVLPESQHHFAKPRLCWDSNLNNIRFQVPGCYCTLLRLVCNYTSAPEYAEICLALICLYAGASTLLS